MSFIFDILRSQLGASKRKPVTANGTRLYAIHPVSWVLSTQPNGGTCEDTSGQRSQQHVTSALLVPGREVVRMLEEQRPRRDDRPQWWPIIATVATVVKTAVDIWRLLRG